MIYFCLGMLQNKSIDDKLDFILNNVKYADSWMITDTPNCYLKDLDFDRYYEFLKKTYLSSHIFTRRIAYILGLKVYRDRRILQILDLSNYIFLLDSK